MGTGPTIFGTGPTNLVPSGSSPLVPPILPSLDHGQWAVPIFPTILKLVSSLTCLPHGNT